MSPFHPSEGIVSSPVMMDLPISLNTVKIVSHRHAQRPDSRVIIDSVRLTINSKYHTQELFTAHMTLGEGLANLVSF